jgi:hypothetical protein
MYTLLFTSPTVISAYRVLCELCGFMVLEFTFSVFIAIHDISTSKVLNTFSVCSLSSMRYRLRSKSPLNADALQLARLLSGTFDTEVK